MTSITVFEGLGGFLFNTPTHVKRGLLDPLNLYEKMNTKSRPIAHTVWRGSFMSRGPLLIPQVVTRPAPKLIVIGHSMGGPTALWWCRQWEPHEIDLLILCDPRPLHRPYIKPLNVKRAVNFYQTGFMRGYPVEGAENVKVSLGHTAVPRAAVELLRLELNQKES